MNRIAVKTGGRVVILDLEEIDWIEAAGNYVRFHVGTEHYRMRKTLTAIQDLLDPERFLRIHRSIIVNIDRVKQITPWNHGDRAVVLRDGTHLNLSRSYRAHVDRFVERYIA